MFVTFILVIIELQVIGNCTPLKCPVSLPLSIPHQYYYPGDIIIGGILSQFYVLSNQITFQRDPSHDVFDTSM